MRNGLIVLWMLLCGITSAAAQVGGGIELPGVSIGIDIPAYPELVPVPGYPVYYAPQLNSNYFFYDGMYWVYGRDNRYASSWYNGPWQPVTPEAVPLFVLRVPVRYYQEPPAYFGGWRLDAPPRWGEHWGNAWEQRRIGWDQWNRGAEPPLAPLPVYQRQYSGARYPRVEQQQGLQSQKYGYQPHDAIVQQHYQAQRVQAAPVSSLQGSEGVPQERISPQQGQRGFSGPATLQRGAPTASMAQPQGGAVDLRKSAGAQEPSQQGGQAAQHQLQPPQQGVAQRERPVPGPQGKGPTQEPRQSQEKGSETGEQRDGERNR